MGTSLITIHTHSHYKTKLMAAIAAQYTSTGKLDTTQTLEPCVANPPGAGLVTHKRTVPVQIEVMK